MRISTDKQQRYLYFLIRRRDVESIGESREILLDAVEEMSVTEASSWIKALLALPELPER